MLNFFKLKHKDDLLEQTPEVVEKLSIDELYQLIDEIKKDEEEYAKIVQERKEKRIKQNEQRNLILLQRLPYYLTFLAVATFLINITSKKNPFKNSELIMSKAEQDKIIDELEKKLNIHISAEDSENYILLNSIFNNKNLTEQQKLETFNLLPLLADNDYINKESFYNTLQNLEIEYIERPDFLKDTVTGTYFFPLHNISIYVAEEDDENDEILNHEKIHSLYTNIKNFTMPHFLCEGMTELLKNEYFSDHPFTELRSYLYETTLVKLICELVGSDTVLESYTTGNVNIIYDKLDSIYGSPGDSEAIISKIDEILDKYYDFDYSFSKEELKSLIIKLERYFIKDKTEKLDGLTPYGYLLYDNRIINNAFYYYENLLLTSTCDNRFTEYTNYLDDVGILKKAYFSEELKKSLLENDKVFVKKSN